MAALFAGLVPTSTPKQREETEAGLYKTDLGSMNGGSALLIIDPQNDFHDGGSLAVPKSASDALKISTMIREGDPNDIFVTLDTHNKYHIAHSNFWKENTRGASHPPAFTVISKEDVQSGRWKASRKEHQKRAEQYVTALEASNKFQLVIWPEHCLIGTPGHGVNHCIMQALKDWEDKHNKPVHYIVKGNHALTEHYSALAAEVPVPGYPETELNTRLLNQLKKFDKLYVCGQAKSHCVNYTVRDLVKNWQPEELSRINVVKDASSSVEGYSTVGEQFEKEMENKGVNVILKAQALEQLISKKEVQ